MASKPITRSVIAAVVVAGILTLSVLAAIPSIHRSQGTTREPESYCHDYGFTISANPSKGSLAAGESIGVKLSGKLSCPGYESAVSGKNIKIAVGNANYHVTTDDNGNYHKDILVPAGTHETITADVCYPNGLTCPFGTTSTTIDIKAKPSGRFTEG